MALKSAELALSVAVGMLLKQQREKRFGLQCRVALEALLNYHARRCYTDHPSPARISWAWCRYAAVRAAPSVPDSSQACAAALVS